jgi:hypothetical protein
LIERVLVEDLPDCDHQVRHFATHAGKSADHSWNGSNRKRNHTKRSRTVYFSSVLLAK